MSIKIMRCYDSHLHWQATGEVLTQLDLRHLKNPQAVADLKVNASHFRGEWLMGFGWDQHLWPDNQFPDKKILDKLFPNNPVFLSRADGHAAWVNSEALKRIGYLNKTESEKPSPQGGLIVRDQNGLPTGVLIDMAKMQIDYILPSFNRAQIKEQLCVAMRLFNQSGFTHIRDMGGFELQWDLMQELADRRELTLAVEQNFPFESLNDLPRAMNLLDQAKKSSQPLLRAKAIKFFYDGALGSEGAYLSQNYDGTESCGLTLWSDEEVKTIFKEAWSKGHEVSVHTIGDQAVHQIVSLALEVKALGFNGSLQLEHVELMRDETIELCKQLQVTCHLQPCHWLTDQKWLKQKVNNLYQYAFQWRKLEESGIQFYFGSDSPIESASLKNNIQAMEQASKTGIQATLKPCFYYHTHPDDQFAPDSYTIWQDGLVQEVVFKGEAL